MWYKTIDKHVQLQIIVKPNAKKSELIAIGDDGLRIALHAKPHKGEANAELISFLSEFLDVPKSHIILKKGVLSRYKLVIVPINKKIRELLNNYL